MINLGGGMLKNWLHVNTFFLVRGPASRNCWMKLLDETRYLVAVLVISFNFYNNIQKRIFILSLRGFESPPPVLIGCKNMANIKLIYVLCTSCNIGDDSP